MNVLCEIRFIGTNYHGWQVQKNAVSVEQVVQDAIETIFGERLDVKGCSRTDSGVHANKYCFNFRCGSRIKPESIPSALNMYLPDDIAVISSCIVPDDFHARYSSNGKEYIYVINNSPQRDPFLFGRSFHWRWHIDEKLLDRCAKDFVGTHDFSAFCSSKSDVDDTVRTVFRADVCREGDVVKFRVAGDGFLYNMVRIMAGTLLRISEKKFDPDCIGAIIESGDRSRAGFTAPACGLFLNDVFYNL